MEFLITRHASSEATARAPLRYYLRELAVLSNYSSMEGVVYCKPHFEQLFKESGNFNKNFQSSSPSNASHMFSSTVDKCATCGKTAYPLEKVTVESQAYHKICFKCSHGGCALSPSNYAALEGILYCKHHFSQLFKEKGSYNHLLKSASMKRAAVSSPEPEASFVGVARSSDGELRVGIWWVVVHVHHFATFESFRVTSIHSCSLFS
ncbi:hypothetical protein QQ045_026450 [Rhodiola kirilowii]